MPASVDWDAVDVVMLDMDGTVLDLAFDNFFWGEAVPRAYADARGIAFDAARGELEPHFEALRGTLPWYSLSHWSQLTGVDLQALKRLHRDRIAPLPGSPDFLAGVRGRGTPVWLVTNADPSALDIKMLQTGLDRQFDRLISSHDFDAPKESPEFWTRMHQRHPYDPARALFVDDSPPVLEAARASGIGQVLGLRWPDSSRPARDVPGTTSVDRLADLLPVPTRRRASTGT